MAQLIRVDDPADPRLADYAALTDAELRKRYEHRAGVIIAEGPNVVRQLVTSPYPTQSVLLAEERVEQVHDVLDAVDVPAYVVTRDLLYEIVRFRLHQGVIASGGRLPPRTPREVIAGARAVAVLDHLNDHENLGTLFRSARALGVGGVLLGPGCADPLYRRCVRVSMGHVLHVPSAPVDDLAAGLADLRAAGFLVVALTPDADAVALPDLRPPSTAQVAVLLGAEGPGLTDAALDGADVRIRIPMDAGVDSLNVATAGAIAFHVLLTHPGSGGRHGWPPPEPRHGAVR